MIDLEQVRKVAQLARLELTSDEEAILPEQLSGILDYVEQLSELDTTDVEPTTRAIDVSNIFREDTQKTFGDRDGLAVSLCRVRMEAPAQCAFHPSQAGRQSR